MVLILNLANIDNNLLGLIIFCCEIYSSLTLINRLQMADCR